MKQWHMLILAAAITLLLGCGTKKYIFGRLYLKDGEVISGRIKVEAEYNRYVNIIPENQRKKRRYPVPWIEFMRINVMEYGLVEINGKKRLLERVAYGTYNLYAYDKTQEHRIQRYFYLETEDGTLPITEDNLDDIYFEYFRGNGWMDQQWENGNWTMEQLLPNIRRYNILTK